MKLLLGIPTIDWKIPVQMVNVLLKMNLKNVHVKTTTRLWIYFARNMFLEEVAKWDYDWLVMLDDDNPPEIENVCQVLAGHWKDYVTGIVRQRTNEKFLNIYKTEILENWITKYTPYTYPKSKRDDLIEVQNCWSACTFLSKKLCKTMLALYPSPFEQKVIDYYKTKEVLDHWMKYAEFSVLNLQRYAPDTNEDWSFKISRRQLSEDLLFGERVRQQWFKIYCDTRVHCYHIGLPSILQVKN